MTHADTELAVAGSGDLSEIEALVQDAYAPYVARIGMKPGPMRDDYAAHVRAGRLRVLRADGRIAGILALEPQDDALLLDSEGRVAETTATNLLMVRDGVLVTPLPTCFLDGITKRHVIGLARQRGLRVEERTVTLEELRAASEVFTAGTSVELQPVVALVEDAVGVT